LHSILMIAICWNVAYPRRQECSKSPL
jgi:hypothetical protein